MVRVFPLMHKVLRGRGLFEREWKTDKEGQTWDLGDNRPFSSEFAFTRFLVPELCRRNDIQGKAVFVDCDFLFLADIQEMLDECQGDKALWCVQHRYKDRAERKLDGAAQQPYGRKLWSSLMVFNMDHEIMKERPSIRDVNERPGKWLHGFEWLPDDLIGQLPEKWNWIPTQSPTLGEMQWPPKAIHYSEQAPWFPDQRDCLDNEVWWTEYSHYLLSLQTNPTDLVRV